MRVREDELARYQRLCDRVRACWTGQGMAFSCPPATEEQLRATEDQLGYALPPLLRLLYSMVANGGNGLIGYDAQFSLIGAQGGYPSPPVRTSPDGQWREGPTIERLVGRSGWTLHPCIATALGRYPGRHVVCSDLPDGVVTIMDVGAQGYALDLVSERIYETWFYGDLPLENNQTVPLLMMSVYCSSLEELVEEYLSHAGCGAPAITPMPLRSRSPRVVGELASGLLDPACGTLTDAGSVWRGLYRGVEEIIHPLAPDDEWGA